MRFPSLVLFPALLLAAASPTAELRKCVAPGGAVSYQGKPCAEGSREAWVQPVKADPVPAPAVRAQAAKPPRASRPAPRLLRTPPRRETARDRRRKRCEKARAEADAKRDRLWNKLDFKARSELDASVARACAR